MSYKGFEMLRSVMLAIGIFLLILGGESLIVDKVVVTKSKKITRIIDGNGGLNTPFQNASYRNSNYYQNSFQNARSQQPKQRTYQTKEWMPWSLLAAGTIVVLYSYSLPRKSFED